MIFYPYSVIAHIFMFKPIVNLGILYRCFLCSRWTTAFGEEYDYNSIMHYSSKAFSKEPDDSDMMTIEPISPDRAQISGLGRRQNLSLTDVNKIKKLYKCSPYENW